MIVQSHWQQTEVILALAGILAVAFGISRLIPRDFGWWDLAFGALFVRLGLANDRDAFRRVAVTTRRSDQDTLTEGN